MVRARSLLVALAVALLAGVAWSQTEPSPEPSPTSGPAPTPAEAASGEGEKNADKGNGKATKRARKLRRLKRKRARILRRKLGLDEARASRLEMLFDEHAEQQRQARVELRRARKQLRRLLREDSDDQAAYKAALDELQAADRRAATLRDTHLSQLREVLTPKEQALLMRMMVKARRHLRRARRRDRQR